MIDLKIEDGIIIVHFPKGLKIDLEGAKQIVKDRKNLQNGKSTPLLVKFDSIVSNSKEIRKFMASEGATGISCAAFIVKNRMAWMFLNMFLNNDKPNFPNRIFFNELEAILWLKSEHKSL